MRDSVHSLYETYFDVALRAFCAGDMFCRGVA